MREAVPRVGQDNSRLQRRSLLALLLTKIRSLIHEEIDSLPYFIFRFVCGPLSAERWLFDGWKLHEFKRIGSIVSNGPR
jgi:hypothetical protein